MSVILPPSVRNPADYPPELRHPAAGAESACYVCGQLRGRRDADELWTEDGPVNPNGPVRQVRHDDGQVVDELQPQPWRWRHVACEPTAAGVVRSILGLEVDERVARTAVAEAEVGTGRTENATDRRPWAFLAPGQRDLLRAVIDRERFAGLARMHVSGRCAWCGRSRSSSWSASGLAWPDGEPAALCEHCVAARQQCRDPFDANAVRRTAMRAFAGLLDSIGRTETYGFRYACEVLDEAHRHDDERGPWQYSPTGLAEVRKRAHRVEAAAIIDDDARVFALRINAARRARAAANEAAQAAEPELQW